jgi:hypothetical protein
MVGPSLSPQQHGWTITVVPMGAVTAGFTEGLEAEARSSRGKIQLARLDLLYGQPS